MKNRPAQPNPLEKSLAVETDTHLFQSLLSGSGLGIGLLFFIASLPQDILRIPPDGFQPKSVIVPPDEVFTGVWKPLEKPKAKPTQQTVSKKRTATEAGRPANSARPKEESGVLVTQVISADTRQIGKSAYEIIQQAFHDLPKLDQVAMLHREGKTRIAGRRGKLNTAFNAEYDMHDGNGEMNLSENIRTLERIDAEAPQSPIPKVSISEQSISQTHENGFRSTASILAVVKSHSPGLRHLYNKHLRTQPGLQGKVSVRFGIDARGMVVSAAIEGTTTGSSPFDEAILQAIRSWRFEPIRHLGIEEVLVPLQFSE